MNEETLRDGLKRLEALDALAKLFSTLWFDKVKGEIRDEKVRAYMTVFEDAFPAMNHVIEYINLSAGDVVDGRVEEVQRRLEVLVLKMLKSDEVYQDDHDVQLDPVRPRSNSDDLALGSASMDTLFEDSGKSENVDDEAQVTSLVNGDMFPNDDEQPNHENDLVGFIDDEDDDIVLDDDEDDDIVLDDDEDDDIVLEGFDGSAEDDSNGLPDDEIGGDELRHTPFEAPFEEEGVGEGKGNIAAGISTEEMNALLDDGEGGKGSAPKKAPRPVRKKQGSSKNNVVED